MSEPPFTEVCVKCGCKLRKTKYPGLTPDRYWFDEQGLAGCSLDGFHAGGRVEVTTAEIPCDRCNLVGCNVQVREDLPCCPVPLCDWCAAWHRSEVTTEGGKA